MSTGLSEQEAESPGAGGIARWLWLVAAALFFVVFAQHYFGVGFKKKIEIDRNSMRADSGHAWKLKLPREHRTNAARFHLEVFEDGTAIGPSEINNRRVRKHGSGRYRLDENGTLRLSASDNSSPVFNGREYSLEIPARVRPFQLAIAVVILLGASLVVRKNSGFAVTKSGPTRVGLMALGVLVVALGVRIWAMGAYSKYSDGGFAVNGIPYSDALAWTELAHSLHEGTGYQGSFAGQRPFYSVFMASVFHVFGESLEAGKMVNVICGALSVLFLCLLVARSTGQWGLGLVGAAALLFDQQQLHDIQLLITEPMGLTLIIVGAYALWAGLLTLNMWTLFAAGALIGFSNLTRTFTMLGLPLFALLVLVACLLQKLSWKRVVLICGMFTLGATCVMAPWMIRQKLRYDTYSLSTVGSDLLYSAATETPGWSKDLYDELEAEGLEREQLGEVHAFYSSRFSEKVKENPGRYFGRLVTWVFEYVTHHDFGGSLTRLTVLSGGLFLALLAWWNGKSFVGGLLLLASAGLAPLLGQLPAGLVLGGALSLALWFGDRTVRWSIVVLIATLLSGAIMSAMIGNFGMNRTSPLTAWIFSVVVFVAMGALARRLIEGPQKQAVGGKADVSSIWNGLPAGISWGLIAIFGFSASLVALTGFANEGTMATGATLETAEKARVRDWVRDLLPGARKAPDEAFFVSVVRVENYLAYVRAGEDTSHWARPFLPRPYGRTAGFVRVLPGEAPGGSLMAVQFRSQIDDVPKGETLVLVGINNTDEDAPLGHDVNMVEAIALIPFSSNGAAKELLYADAKLYPVTPEAATILSGGQ